MSWFANQGLFSGIIRQVYNPNVETVFITNYNIVKTTHLYLLRKRIPRDIRYLIALFVIPNVNVPLNTIIVKDPSHSPAIAPTFPNAKDILKYMYIENLQTIVWLEEWLDPVFLTWYDFYLPCKHCTLPSAFRYELYKVPFVYCSGKKHTSSVICTFNDCLENATQLCVECFNPYCYVHLDKNVQNMSRIDHYVKKFKLDYVQSCHHNKN